MHGSKLSLIVVFMVSAVAARLIPNGDVDKEHNSDDQERLDRQDYTPHMIRPKIFKPAILATGICVQSPSLPCCKHTISIYEIMRKRPFVPADLSYPNCRDDGYYAAKQCEWYGCHCVDPNGNGVEGTAHQPENAYYYNNYNIICPGESPETSPIKDLGSHEYEVEPADKLLTSEEISHLPDLPDEEDPETAGKTIDELTGGGNDIVLPGRHHRAARGCVQWGEPCTRETDCCGDTNYEGICERFLCQIKVKASAKKIKGRKGLQRQFSTNMLAA